MDENNILKRKLKTDFESVLAPAARLRRKTRRKEREVSTRPKAD